MPDIITDIIIKKIRHRGPISFRDFMEMALYYPGLGYYTSGKEIIGKTGDFYTGPDLTPALGELLGKQIEEMWHILGEKEFTVVEMGAGTGILSSDVLSYLKKNKELFQTIDYCIVEKSSALRKQQSDLLEGENITWYDSIKDLCGINGCIFSNELPDAFPVHVVVMGNELMEIYVDYEKHFFEIQRPASTRLSGYLEELDVLLPQGYRTEINLDAIKWIEEIGHALEKGFLITIDYGYTSDELYREYRDLGTLMCYHKHTLNESPFEHIGEQDMTSHVNFSALDHWGRKNGLELAGFTDMAHFLISLGIDQYVENLREKSQVDYYKNMLPLKTLIMEMGERFKVMIQKKSSGPAGLSGLKFPSPYCKIRL